MRKTCLRVADAKTMPLACPSNPELNGDGRAFSTLFMPACRSFVSVINLCQRPQAMTKSHPAQRGVCDGVADMESL